MDAKYEWDLKLKELKNINDCTSISHQIKTLRLNENKYQSKLVDL